MKLPFPIDKLPTFPWTDPGSNPYTGSFAKALLNYAGEIPAAPLNTLQDLIATPAKNGRYVVIDRAGIRTPDGAYVYGHLRMMHFGTDRLVRGVMDTSMWPDGVKTGALVFEAAQYCVCIPTVCRNLSLCTRFKPAPTEYVQPPPKLFVPEPGSLELACAAGAVMWLIRRRKKLRR